MKSVKELARKICEQMSIANYLLFAVLVLGLFLMGVLYWQGSLTPTLRGWFFIGIAISWVGIFITPTFGLAKKGHRSIVIVITLSAVSLAVFVTMFYLAFFSFPISSDDLSAARHLLSIPPVLVAIWAASVGWYIHYQLSTKASRTNNSFGIVMQMQTSPEFLKHSTNLRRHYPFGSSVPRTDSFAFGPDAEKELRQARAEGKADADWIAKLKKVRALQSLKYLLNYYEFIAVGINAKDLDEDILYDTVGVIVVSQFDRAKEMISSYATSQPLAFEELKVLVDSWRKRLKQQEREVEDRRETARAVGSN